MPRAKHPGGRPRKPDAERRSQSVILRLTPAEYERLWKDAKRASSATLSDFIRERLGLTSR